MGVGNRAGALLAIGPAPRVPQPKGSVEARCILGRDPAVGSQRTDIRRRLKDRQSLRGLVPDAVLNDFTARDLEMLRRS